VHNLSRELAGRGIEVHVITSSSAAAFDAASMPPGFHFWPILSSWTWSWRDRSAVSALRRCLRRIRPDVVHVVYPSSDRPNGYHIPALLRLLAGCPVVTTFFSLSLLRGVTMATRLSGIGLIWSGTILISHDPFYLTFLRLLSSWRLGRVRYVPVGANVAAPEIAYKPDSVSAHREALGLPQAEHYVSHFGFVDSSRDIDTLLEAVRRLREKGRDVRLIMIGGTEPAPTQDLSDHQQRFRADIAARARKLGEAVIWTGYCPDDAVTKYFLASDCTVLPFHRNTFGRTSLAAALQHGVPVITTASGPRALFLRHRENAMLVPADRPGRLVAALEEVLGSADLRARLGRGALEAAEWYRWERVAAMSVATYREAVGRRWRRGER
jgi:glycosyltransferase involved in cell wall biosynthesis